LVSQRPYLGSLNASKLRLNALQLPPYMQYIHKTNRILCTHNPLPFADSHINR
jgi:hypothetical protein